MKIDLNKEEWKLLNSILGNIIVFRDDETEETLEKIAISLNIYHKLGIEWIDE